MIASIIVALYAAVAGPLPAQTGSIVGRVAFTGAPPAPRALSVTADQEQCGRLVSPPDVVIKDGKVAHAVVALQGASGEVPPREYVLANHNCLFTPPVLAAAVGGTLVIENRDPVLHNANVVLEVEGSTRSLGNVALPRPGMAVKKPRALRWPGRIHVTCDAHDWMEATIWVFDHPFFAATGEDGAFEIRGIPPGGYVLTVWHPVLGELEKPVEVKADHELELVLRF